MKYLALILGVGIVLVLFILGPKFINRKASQETERQEVITRHLTKQKCIDANWIEYDYLWNKDCKALKKENDCTLPLSLSLIIEEKIGCR